MELGNGQSIDLERELTRGFAAGFVKYKAGQLVGRAGITSVDRHDIEQEMKLRLIKRFDKFDPNKAHWNVFVTTVVERHVATILEYRRRIKRVEDCMPNSLSELVEDCDHELVELGETLGLEEREAVIGRYQESDETLTDLQQDVNDLLSDMPSEYRQLCELLKLHTITEAARIMGIPRTTASSMLSRVRSQFAENNFHEFFQKQ